MTRTGIITFAVVLFALVLGIGYYSSNEPTEGQRAQCVDQFASLDSVNNDNRLEYNEFLAYGDGASAEDFARADADTSGNISVQEFCIWSGAATETG